MPPEPPHSQADDRTNEDEETSQAQLDGYQPLSAQAVDSFTNFSGSSESSSDESDEEAGDSAGLHRICMTIQWPDDERAQQASHQESSTAIECGSSHSSQVLEACLQGTPHQDRTGNHGIPPPNLKQLSSDQTYASVNKTCPADQDRSANQNHSPVNQSDSSADQNDTPSHQIDSPTNHASSADTKNTPSLRTSPLSGAMSDDQTEAVRLAMRTVRLPAAAVPDWARGLSERQCRQRIGQMVARLKTQR